VNFNLTRSLYLFDSYSIPHQTHHSIRAEQDTLVPPPPLNFQSPELSPSSRRWNEMVMALTPPPHLWWALFPPSSWPLTSSYFNFCQPLGMPWWPTSIGDRNSLRGKYYPNLLIRHKGSQRIYVSLNRWVVNSAAPGNSLARSGLSVATVL
jgi:hypothetical protein